MDREHLEKSARAGDAESQYQLAQLLETSGAVASPGERWDDWCRKAAEQGHLGAMFALGTSLLDGDGVEADVEQGLRWLSRASDEGDEHAAFSLALLYLFGDRVPEDGEKGRKYAVLAAERGLPKAQVMLAADKLDGGDPAEVDDAKAWLSKAMKSHPESGPETGLWISTLERLRSALEDQKKDTAEVDGWIEHLQTSEPHDHEHHDHGVEPFVRALVEHETVYFLEDPEGARATGTAEEQGHELILAWSNEAGARAMLEAAGEALEGYAVEGEELYEFLGATLPELSEEGLRVVLDCQPDMSGIDVDPDALRKRLFAVMSDEQVAKFDALAAESGADE